MGQQQSKDELLYNQVNYANPLVMNDDCQAPLDVARAKGYVDVLCFACLSLYAIEAFCLYSFYCSNSLNKEVYVLINAFACSWVVVLPIGSRNHTKPFKLGLAIYSSCQVKTGYLALMLGYYVYLFRALDDKMHVFRHCINSRHHGLIIFRKQKSNLHLATKMTCSSFIGFLTHAKEFHSSSSTSEWTMIEVSSSTISTEVIKIHNNDISAVPPTSIPSAPPATKEVVEDSPIQYQSIGSTPINVFLKL
ncbi:hypothetical protein J1N35_016502 [Gossypium stocksii]|uniref:Transmembrane protein n=1 Tax=Gossypium stocksii TaxID=47602 RepID=A0A9D4A586_9ROSI|nr:hypothetical protein J1N35_016502 [Gossypium stocksii]